MGINDCGSTDADELEPIVESVFDAVHDLYVKAGARNFVLVDVPPIDRSPQGPFHPTRMPKPSDTPFCVQRQTPGCPTR